MTKVSEFFTLEELTFSKKAQELGLANVPDAKARFNLQRTASQLDKLRAHLGKPVIVKSGYRSPAVNKAVGGSATSYHLSGQAVDFICPGFGSPYEVCLAILELQKKDASFLLHELIQEHGEWVHVAFPSLGELARNRIRTARRRPYKVGRLTRGRVIYVPGIYPQ